jgi:SRSO17 transposase
LSRIGQGTRPEPAQKAWRRITWREGSNAPLTSRFAARRVRPASRDEKRTTPHPVEWLLVEWPKGETEPTKYWLSTLPEDTPLAVLVDYAKLRWRIERDYEELKSELGLGHYEGRGWTGFHHHATLCIAAYGFLICEKEAFPPSTPEFQTSLLPENYRPRGAAGTPRTARHKLDRDDQTMSHRRPCQETHAMSMLPDNPPPKSATATLMTQ